MMDMPIRSVVVNVPDPDRTEPQIQAEDTGFAIAPALRSVEEEFSGHSADFARLKHRDQAFRRLVAYYTSLSHNIGAIESGVEPASAEFLAMLKNQHSQTRDEISAALAQTPLY
jgi:uncharacterized protein YdcH (DUF465 family)